MAQENEKYRILMVSNESKFLNKLSVLFENSKYIFELSRDVLTAITEIKSKNYDLIIINYTFSKKVLELFIRKIHIFNKFPYIILLTENEISDDACDIIKNYDIISYYNKNEDFNKLVILVGLATYSIYEFMKINIQVDSYSNNSKSPYLRTIQILRNIVEYKDKYTIGHSFRVSKYAMLIGKRMGLSSSDLKILKIGSMFHDIGKISTPNSILLKNAKLSEKEYFQVKLHPTIGCHILYPTKIYSKVIPIVKFHHERFDGLGYPTKLKGYEIPLLTRIVTIADTFDAMTSKRTYRDSLPINVVISEFEKNRGLQFDPKITDIFLDILKNDSKIKKIQEKYK